MVEWFVNLDPILQAFLATCFTWFITALGAAMVFFFKEINQRMLDALLGFAAGAMIFVVVEELIPESQLGKHADIATAGAMLGFVVMMALDVALG
jgi:ZIP family zinc transporter